MGAMLAGSLGVPLTAILFSVELTHFWPALVPLTLACVSSYLVAVLIMPRSILTEKLSRRGYHLTREYGVDPLELILVGDLISRPANDIDFNSEVSGLYVFADQTTRSVAEQMATESVTELAVLDRSSGKFLGKVALSDLMKGRRQAVVREKERLRLFGIGISRPPKPLPSQSPVK
jgi:CIC family chloride channel protein